MHHISNTKRVPNPDWLYLCFLHVLTVLSCHIEMRSIDLT